MALRDKACYTLTLIPSLRDPAVLELVEASAGGPISAPGEARFARVRETHEGEVYSSAIYDSYSGAKLASTGYVSDRVKSRRLELHGPDEPIPFEFTGKLGFEWTFTFEKNQYKWKREGYGVGKAFICSLDRRPDPPVEICLAREADRSSPARLQVLHYNIDRFFGSEIRDLRGLETLLVASLLCLLDTAEERTNGLAARQRPQLTSASSSTSADPPQPPPRIVTEEDYEPENPNEILVGTLSDVDAHVARAIGLLEDKSVLFIVIRTRNAAAAQRALEVSLGVKRFRHREELPDLHQYVIEEEDLHPSPPVPPKGPKVIKLDEPKPSQPEPAPGWTPPPNLAIYLSTIELPDLKPGRRESARRPSSSSIGTGGSVLSPNVTPPPLTANAPQPGNGKVKAETKSEKDSKLGKLLRPNWKQS